MPSVNTVTVGQQTVSSAYVTTLTFNGSCPSSVTSQQQLMTSLSVELNRRALCVWSNGLPVRDICDTSNYAVCPGASSRTIRRTRRSSSLPLTLSIVLYAPRTYVIMTPSLTLRAGHGSRPSTGRVESGRVLLCKPP